VSFFGEPCGEFQQFERISVANPEGTKWTGKCWYVHNLLKYEFDIPFTYPATTPELSMEKLTRCIEEERFASQFILNHCGRKLVCGMSLFLMQFKDQWVGFLRSCNFVVITLVHGC
ncbi:hypothetical protein IFM89_037958, partial [Coptis chinensis]